MTLVRAVGSNPSALNHKELPNVNISGVSGFNQWGSAGWVHENFNRHDVLSWTHGKHTISTGFDIDRHHDDDKFTSALLRPSLASVNAQFTKEFKIERFGIEFRADLFNLFNRVNLTSPESDLSSGTFGYSTSQNIPRSAQFGLHFSL